MNDTKDLSLEERAAWALDLAVRYGQIDGDHHKAWVIDQVVRLLAADGYNELIDSDWDTGIAP